MIRDFIIVGRGLAATCLMHRFKQQGISFITIGNPQLSLSSKVAAGIYNPVVFKRLTSSWMANQLIPSLLKFYKYCEETLNEKLIFERQLLKPFTEEQEKKHWQKKSRAELGPFLDETLYDATEQHHHFKIKNQFGIVKNAGNLNIAKFIQSSDLFFEEHIIDDIIDYQQIKSTEEIISYKSFQAKNIIFCEGYLVKHNPFFNWIPLVPAKGEILTIQCDELKLKDFIFNRDGFILDLGNNYYKVGATYEWGDLNDLSTQDGLKSLKKKIDLMIDADYKIVSHEAGVRPSSKDRRPIIGPHPKRSNCYIFNGLGAKGVMLSPFFSENFVHFYLQKEKLHREVDIKRFYDLYEPSTY